VAHLRSEFSLTNLSKVVSTQSHMSEFPFPLRFFSSEAKELVSFACFTTFIFVPIQPCYSSANRKPETNDAP